MRCAIYIYVDHTKKKLHELLGATDNNQVQGLWISRSHRCLETPVAGLGASTKGRDLSIERPPNDAARHGDAVFWDGGDFCLRLQYAWLSVVSGDER